MTDSQNARSFVEMSKKLENLGYQPISMSKLFQSISALEKRERKSLSFIIVSRRLRSILRLLMF